MNERNEGMQDDDEVMRAARALPRDVAPARDLWPGIEAGIANTARPGRREWPWKQLVARAAAVVLLIGGSSGVTWLALQDGGAGVPAPDATEPLRFATVAGSFGSRYHLGPEFVDAHAALASNMDEKLAELPPETRVAVERNITDIRAAIGEINRALADQPDNSLLQDLLMDAYREELSLMRKVDSIARNAAMRRTDI